jgi:hypothetical protein
LLDRLNQSGLQVSLADRERGVMVATYEGEAAPYVTCGSILLYGEGEPEQIDASGAASFDRRLGRRSIEIDRDLKLDARLVVEVKPGGGEAFVETTGNYLANGGGGGIKSPPLPLNSPPVSPLRPRSEHLVEEAHGIPRAAVRAGRISWDARGRGLGAPHRAHAAHPGYRDRQRRRAALPVRLDEYGENQQDAESVPPGAPVHEQLGEGEHAQPDWAARRSSSVPLAKFFNEDQ